MHKNRISNFRDAVGIDNSMRAIDTYEPTVIYRVFICDFICDTFDIQDNQHAIAPQAIYASSSLNSNNSNAASLI